MKKIFFLLFFINYLFAVKDFMIKPHINLYRITDSTSLNYPQSLDSQPESDEYNIFKYSEHFRIIFGKDYNNSVVTNNLANKIITISNIVWDKEVEEFGFRPPRNTQNYYIDIYIANKNTYNPEIGYISIPSSYCGYATSYSDGTPYFVINPDMNENLIKVTMAHEFFHTIQYAYGLDDVNYSIWDKNIWFLEATAVMMEDEVFDDVNDYINYLPYYFNHTNDNINEHNNAIEYGKVIFAKYIKEKYGIEKIKKIFEDYEKNESILDDLKKEFNFDRLMLDFAKCLVNKNSCFEEGENYPDIYFYTQNNLSNIGYYGILFLNEGNDSYLSSLNNEYLQEDFKGTLNRKININRDGLIVINKQDNDMDANIINYNNYSGINIKKGWNLVSNIFANELNLSDLNGVVFWVYRNGEYKAYSNLENYKKAINKSNLTMENGLVYENEGFWVYSDRNISIRLDYSSLSDNNITLKNGWQIAGFSSAFGPQYVNAKIIWEYDNNWSYYSDKYFNYPRLDLIKPLKGYFILK